MKRTKQNIWWTFSQKTKHSQFVYAVLPVSLHVKYLYVGMLLVIPYARISCLLPSYDICFYAIRFNVTHRTHHSSRNFLFRCIRGPGAAEEEGQRGHLPLLNSREGVSRFGKGACEMGD